MQKILVCPWLAPCRMSPEEELESIRAQRLAQREAWLRQWDSETERLLEECRKRRQQPELLMLSLSGGRDTPADAATLRTAEGRCILRAKREVRLCGETLQAGQEREVKEPALLHSDKGRWLLLTGAEAAEARKRGTVVLLESIGRQEVLLLGEELILGREHPWKHGTLDDLHVSRNHARIRLTPEGYTLTDLGRDGTGSTNGTYLLAPEDYTPADLSWGGTGFTNGIDTDKNRLEPGVETPIRPGSLILVGNEKNCLIFHAINIREEQT